MIRMKLGMGSISGKSKGWVSNSTTGELQEDKVFRVDGWRQVSRQNCVCTRGGCANGK